MSDLLIGESFVGTGPNAAHVNTVLGHRSGPAGVAWATALATPSQGHVPFMVVAQPSIVTKPVALFVTKAAISSPEHGRLTWGAAQAGVAAGIGDGVREGIITRAEADSHVLIVAVWVDPTANDEEQVFRNNRVATAEALTRGRRGEPSTEDFLAAATDPQNPFFR